MLTSGAIEALELRRQGAHRPGDRVLVEAPTYLGAIMAFQSFEAEVEGVPVDEDGLDGRRARADARRRTAARSSLYTIPDFQNPAGVTLPTERREALVELARRHGLLVIEDVAYRELRFEGERSADASGASRPTSSPGGHVLEDVLPRRAPGLGGGPGRARLQARLGEAEHRPVRGRARPAAARGVRPPRPSSTSRSCGARPSTARAATPR